jgi:hypothetical protein
MLTYSRDTITTTLPAYRNGEFTSIREYAYTFNIPNTTLSEQLRSRISRSKSHELQKTLSNTEEEVRLKAITRLSKSGLSIILPLTNDLPEEIRLFRFRLTSIPTAYLSLGKN